MPSLMAMDPMDEEDSMNVVDNYFDDNYTQAPMLKTYECVRTTKYYEVAYDCVKGLVTTFRSQKIVPIYNVAFLKPPIFRCTAYH